MRTHQTHWPGRLLSNQQGQCRPGDTAPSRIESASLLCTRLTAHSCRAHSLLLQMSDSIRELYTALIDANSQLYIIPIQLPLTSCTTMYNSKTRLFSSPNSLPTHSKFLICHVCTILPALNMTNNENNNYKRRILNTRARFPSLTLSLFYSYCSLDRL